MSEQKMIILMVQGGAGDVIAATPMIYATPLRSRAAPPR